MAAGFEGRAYDALHHDEPQRHATAGELRAKMAAKGPTPQFILDAMREAMDAHDHAGEMSGAGRAIVEAMAQHEAKTELATQPIPAAAIELPLTPLARQHSAAMPPRGPIVLEIPPTLDEMLAAEARRGEAGGSVVRELIDAGNVIGEAAKAMMVPPAVPCDQPGYAPGERHDLCAKCYGWGIISPEKAGVRPAGTPGEVRAMIAAEVERAEGGGP